MWEAAKVTVDMEHPCIKIVGWWIFKHKAVIHNYKAYAISKFMRSSETFHLHSECENCGITKERAFVEKDELIMMGISSDVIENIETWHSLTD